MFSVTLADLGACCCPPQTPPRVEAGTCQAGVNTQGCPSTLATTRPLPRPSLTTLHL